jgi:hypothetical protein
MGNFAELANVYKIYFYSITLLEDVLKVLLWVSKPSTSLSRNQFVSSAAATTSSHGSLFCGQDGIGAIAKIGLFG